MTRRLHSGYLLCCLAFAASIPMAALAGVTPEAPTHEARGLGEIESLDARSMPSRPMRKRVLRCWQKGYLLFEREVAQLPTEATHSVQIPVESGAPLQLYDLENATCLID